MNPVLVSKLQKLLKLLPKGLPEKDLVLRLSLLAFLAGESVFLLGPPGVAKSLIARRLKYAFQGAKAFEYLMGRFSTPDEIFGPLSISGLRDRDVFERKTEGYLPEADIVFLDEIWRASPPIQNALLAVLNEKVFRNGGREIQVPLKGFIGASNRIPEDDEAAEAFWDRFLVRLEVGNLKNEENFKALISDTSDLYQSPLTLDQALSPQDYLDFQNALPGVLVPPEIQATLVDIRRRLQTLESQEGGSGTASVYVSDRRWKKSIRLLKASALAHGRLEVEVMDIFLLGHCFWSHKVHKALVEDTILASIHENGLQPPFSFDDLEGRFKQLQENLTGLVRESKEVEISVPQLFQQEYYTLQGFRPSVVTRIWAEDFDLLGDHQPRECEVYFFAKGYTYSFSEKHILQRRGEGVEIQVDSQTYTLESQQIKKTVTHERSPDNQALEIWENEARQFSESLSSLDKELTEFHKSAVERSQGHLFVPLDRIPATLNRLRAAEIKLSDLRIRVQRLISLKQPEIKV